MSLSRNRCTLSGDMLLRNWFADMGDFWVFGYGSLMWRPGFAHVETERARLHGFRRSLCVYSWVHRGSRERPGLVLGLDRGGSCIGLAFRVPGDLRDEVVVYLRERELVTNVHLERLLTVRLANGAEVPALCYVVDRDHEQYAGTLTAEGRRSSAAVSDNPAAMRNTCSTRSSTSRRSASAITGWKAWRRCCRGSSCRCRPAAPRPRMP